MLRGNFEIGRKFWNLGGNFLWCRPKKRSTEKLFGYLGVACSIVAWCLGGNIIFSGYGLIRGTGGLRLIFTFSSFQIEENVSLQELFLE